MIKKFRMGVSSLIERYIFQIFFLLFVPVTYLTIVAELFTIIIVNIYLFSVVPNIFNVFH